MINILNFSLIEIYEDIEQVEKLWKEIVAKQNDRFSSIGFIDDEESRILANNIFRNLEK